MRCCALLMVVLAISGQVLAGHNNPNINNVPKPILENHPEWVDLYYAAFKIAFSKIQQGTPENGFVPYYMDEAFSSNIFQWDTNFMMFFGRYGNGELPSIVSLENFYMAQDSTGWICREIYESNGKGYWPKEGSLEANCSINPPLFSWAEWNDFEISADTARFTKLVSGKPIIDILVDYFDWIKANRRIDNGLYWTTSYANGMDRSPRMGTTHVCDHGNGGWIDITAQQALNALYISKIANVIGRPDLVARFEREHAEIKDLINTTLWDEKDGFYYDQDSTGSLCKTKTPASFWTLIAEVTTDNHEERLIKEHITNPDEFWTHHHLPTVAKNDPGYRPDGGYWDGAVWAPTTYQTIKGLEKQGHDSLALIIAMNHIENIYQVYKTDSTIYENYHQESYHKGHHARADFVGWTGCGPIACLIENVIGIRANAPADAIFWDMRLDEKHGIENLKFGDNTVSMSSDDKEIHLKTNNQFFLVVQRKGKTFSYTVPKGESIFKYD